MEILEDHKGYLITVKELNKGAKTLDWNLGKGILTIRFYKELSFGKINYFSIGVCQRDLWAVGKMSVN